MARLEPQDAAKLIDAEPQTYVAAIGQSRGRELVSWLIASHAQLRGDPALAARVRSTLSTGERLAGGDPSSPEDAALVEVFERWMGRRLLDVEPWLTVKAFCALATSLARSRDPSFPELDPEDYEVTFSIPQCKVRGLDTRVDERGWTSMIQKAYEGPAETIDDFTWRAVAHGEAWTATVGHDRPARGTACVWCEGFD